MASTRTVVKFGFIDFKELTKSATAVCNFYKSKTSITESSGFPQIL